MENFIDDFSKRIASTTSRRDMLRTAVRTIFAGFVSSTGIAKLWGQTDAVSSQVCPTCGTCQMCVAEQRVCGLPCPPCTAASLCKTAQQLPDYAALYNFLGTNFKVASNPRALRTINPDGTFTSVLTTLFVTNDSTVTVVLFFTLLRTHAKESESAYAIQYKDGTPVLGYVASANNGPIQLLLPPSSISTANGDSNLASSVAQVNASANDFTLPISQGTCETLFAGLCALKQGTEFLDCVAIAGAACTAIGLVTNPAIGVGCAIIMTRFCSLSLDAEECEDVVDSYCLCPEITCGQTCPPQTCVNGVCQPAKCPDNTTCINGSCVCHNPCGASCCSSTETCSNGTCITTCPPGQGQTACGTTCCPFGETCSNGSCVLAVYTYNVAAAFNDGSSLSGTFTYAGGQINTFTATATMPANQFTNNQPSFITFNGNIGTSSTPHFGEYFQNVGAPLSSLMAGSGPICTGQSLTGPACISEIGIRDEAFVLYYGLAYSGSIELISVAPLPLT